MIIIFIKVNKIEIMNKPVAVENKEVYSPFDVSVQKVIEGREFGGERAL